MEQTFIEVSELLAALSTVFFLLSFLLSVFAALKRYVEFDNCEDEIESNSEISEVYENESNNVIRYDLPDCFYE